MRMLGQACSLHASAALALGQADLAFDDIHVIQKLAEVSGQEPNLVSEMYSPLSMAWRCKRFGKAGFPTVGPINIWPIFKSVFLVSIFSRLWIKLSEVVNAPASITSWSTIQMKGKLAGVFVTRTSSGLWDAFRQRLIEGGVRYSPRSWRYKNQFSTTGS